MTGTDLATVDTYARSSLDERQRYATLIAGAGALLSQSVRQQGAAGVFLMAETGAMLGIHPVAALQGVHVIEGKPTLSANLLAALVRRAGHKLRVSTKGAWADGTFVATAILIREDDPDFEFKVEWTRERAQAAGLVGKRGPWSQYPEAMCKSRAITEVIREGASDVTIIPAYSPEELGAENVDESGELIQVRDGDTGPVVPRETTERKAAPIVDEAPVQDDAPEHPAEGAPVDEATGEVKSEDAPVQEKPFEWKAAVEGATTAEEVRDLYRRAKAEGLLNLEVRRGRQPKRVLGPWLIEIGKALDQAEQEADAAEAEAMVFAEAEAEQVSQGGTPEDGNVIDAEVVEDGES